MQLKDLREKIANLAKQANHIVAEKGSIAWTAEEQKQFDNFIDEIEAAKKQLKSIENLRALEADKFFTEAIANVGGQHNGQGQRQDDGSISVLNAVALYLRNGNNVTPEQAVAIRNAMSTTTSAEGGFTVPAEVASMVIDKLKAFGGMREVASVITTASGVDMSWPTSDPTGDVGEIVGQNAAASAGDITFGTTLLKPFYYSSKNIALPLELIQDSAIDVIGYVIDRLATRIARIQNTHFTVGAGTTLPLGVVPAASVGKTAATGGATSITYDDLVDLKHSVNRAYRSNAVYMMNDLSVAIVSKLKDTSGRPVWVPGDSESIVNGRPDTLCGQRVATNDDMAVMAANAKSVVFGDFSKYTIRDVANTTVIRRFDDSAFALKNQVGFCGWQRTGGALLDTAAVKVFQNSAT